MNSVSMNKLSTILDLRGPRHVFGDHFGKVLMESTFEGFRENFCFIERIMSVEEA